MKIICCWTYLLSAVDNNEFKVLKFFKNLENMIYPSVQKSFNIIFNDKFEFFTKQRQKKVY